uniref:Uncharacterized protein n=1 Tax=Felis catus TaxID=9685 RepID=A0ABI7X449_FELCA
METVRTPRPWMTPRPPVNPRISSHPPAVCRRRGWTARIRSMLMKPPTRLWDNL